MKSMRIPGGIYVGFGLVALLFLSLYVLLSFHNRPAADDFYFFHAVSTKGIWVTATDAYHTWITRWSTLLFLGVSVKLFDTEHSLFLFQLVTLFAMTAGAGLLLYKMMQVTCRNTPGIFRACLYALLFVLSFFYLSFHTGENWFWFTSECMYLLPVIALLFGSYFLLKPGNGSIPIVLSSACFLFIGGGSEVVALEALGALFIVTILLYRNNPLSRFLQQRLVIFSLGALLLSLFIAWLGPGRVLRQEALNPASFSNQLILSIKATFYFLLARLPLKAPWLLFSTVPWLVLKNKMEPGDEKPVPVVFRAIGRDFLFFLLFVFIHFGLVSFLLRSFPPYRTWITVSLALAVFCAVSGWRLGSLIRSNTGIVSASVVYCVVAGILLIENIASQQTLVSSYSKKADERMLYLKSNSGSKMPVLVVEPLPPSGMLYSAEINSDTNYFTNKQLREYLELNAPVRMDGEPIDR